MKRNATPVTALTKCQFAATVFTLIQMGKSKYEIALIIKAHPKLISEYIFTQELNVQTEANDKRYFDFLRARMKKENAVHSTYRYGLMYVITNDSFIFCLNYAKTLQTWDKKYRENDTLLSNAVEIADGASINNKNLSHAFLMPLATLFLVIEKYLNNTNLRSILKTYNLSKEQWEQLKISLALPEVDDKIKKEQLERLIDGGGTPEMAFDEIPGVTQQMIALAQHELQQRAIKQKQADEAIYMKLMYTCKGTRLCRNRFIIRRGKKGVVYLLKGTSAAHVCKKIGVTPTEINIALPRMKQEFERVLNRLSKNNTELKPIAQKMAIPVVMEAKKPVSLSGLYIENLRQKKCKQYFSLGYDIDVIANLMNTDEFTVNRMLREVKPVYA